MPSAKQKGRRPAISGEGDATAIFRNDAFLLDDEKLKELAAMHPGNLTPGIITRLAQIRTVSHAADRILALREKWLYDTASTESVGNPFPHADILAALCMNKEGRWPQLRHNPGKPTGRVRLFTPAFVEQVEQPDFQAALAGLEVEHPKLRGVLGTVRGEWMSDGSYKFHWNAADPLLVQAVERLSETLWAIVRMRDGT